MCLDNRFRKKNNESKLSTAICLIKYDNIHNAMIGRVFVAVASKGNNWHSKNFFARCAENFTI